MQEPIDYYFDLDAGIGDIIRDHSDPRCGMGYAADAQGHGHSITCLVNSFWRHSVMQLLQLNPAINRFILSPPWFDMPGVHLFEKMEAARRVGLSRLQGERLLLADRHRFVYRPASLYLSRRDFDVLGIIPGKYIAVQARSVGVSTTGKKWPYQHWEQLARGLSQVIPEHSLVVLGTHGTSRGLEQFPQVVDLTGRTTLREAIAVLSRADALIGIDSFLRCAAYHCGIPSVALYQPPSHDPEGHFSGFFRGANAPQHRVLKAQQLGDIAPEQVCDALLQVLSYAECKRQHVEVLAERG